ncbi:MAG: hypothetical protein AAGI46_04550 [Planctomycetota bacterium]
MSRAFKFLERQRSKIVAAGVVASAAVVAPASAQATGASPTTGDPIIDWASFVSTVTSEYVAMLGQVLGFIILMWAFYKGYKWLRRA